MYVYVCLFILYSHDIPMIDTRELSAVISLIQGILLHKLFIIVQRFISGNQQYSSDSTAGTPGLSRHDPSSRL